MGWKIVRHSFVLLVNNFANALRVSIGPYLIGIVVVYALISVAGVPWQALINSGNPAALMRMMGGTAVIAILLCWAILLFVSSWVAVSWHRYVLVEEYPGLLPGLPGATVMGYLGRTLLLVLIVVLVSIPLSFIVGVIGGGIVASGSGATTILGAVLGLAFVTILFWIWMRFGLVLPAVAVGRPISLGDAWSASSRLSGAIFQAVLILFALLFVASLALGQIFGNGWIGSILGLIVNWVSVMVGISILTTLYGHLIEDRSLP